MYNACLQPTLFYVGETLALNDLDLQCLKSNNRAMLHWIFVVKSMAGVSPEDLLAKLHLFDATVELRIRHQ